MKNFPDFDFKIDCGDDPKVRQWLHDNGCLHNIDAHRADYFAADLKTIPSICMRDQAMPMMLGGDFGGQHESD